MEEISFEKLDMAKFYGASAVGLIGTRILLYLPMSLKTRMQAEEERSVRKILKQNSLRSLYKGVGTVAFGIVPTQWIYLTVLELSKSFGKAHFKGLFDFVLHDSRVAGMVERMLTNAFAGAARFAFLGFFTTFIYFCLVLAQVLLLEFRWM
jgi:hypothetical protein